MFMKYPWSVSILLHGQVLSGSPDEIEYEFSYTELKKHLQRRYGHRKISSIDVYKNGKLFSIITVNPITKKWEAMKPTKSEKIQESTPAEKIVKMLSLAARPGTKAEGQAARANAERIAKQYGIDIDSLQNQSSAPISEWDHRDASLLKYGWKLVKTEMRGQFRKSAHYANPIKMPAFKLVISEENGLLVWALVAPKFGAFLSSTTDSRLYSVLEYVGDYMQEYKEIVAERELATKAKFTQVAHPSENMKEFNKHRWELQNGKGLELHIQMSDPQIVHSRGGYWMLIQLKPWRVIEQGPDAASLKKALGSLAAVQKKANFIYGVRVEYPKSAMTNFKSERIDISKIAKTFNGVEQRMIGTVDKQYFVFETPEIAQQFVAKMATSVYPRMFGIYAHFQGKVY